MASPRGSGRKARLERRQERRQSSGFARFVGFETEIFDSNKRFCWLKRPPWADVLDTCIRRVATSPNTGRRLAWHSVNSMGAEYFRQRAKDSGRSLTWRQEIVSNRLETGDRRKLFFEGAEVWGSGFFPSWIDIAWMAKVRPSFLLCLPTQLLTPILCTVCHDLSTEHKLLIEARHGAAAPQLMAEILTRKMASTKICEGLVKLPSACSCIRGCSFPSRTGAIVSSPVFVGEKLARFGAAISSLTKCLWLAALYSLISTRAGALPKINR